MISVNLQNNIVALRDIRQEQLTDILSWCNMTEDFRFAIGMDGPVLLKDLECKYKQTLSSELEFFLGIYSLYEDRLIGIITGKLAGSVLWINMLAIGLEFRGKGYGRTSIDLLLRNMMAAYGIKTAYLAVAANNTRGRCFWLHNGFCDERLASNKVELCGTRFKVIIMKKQL